MLVASPMALVIKQQVVVDLIDYRSMSERNLRGRPSSVPRFMAIDLFNSSIWFLLKVSL